MNTVFMHTEGKQLHTKLHIRIQSSCIMKENNIHSGHAKDKQCTVTI